MFHVPLILNIALIINVFVWASLYTQRRGNALYQSYFLYVIPLIWWQIADLSYAIPFLEPYSLIISRIASIGWFGIAPMFLNFVYTLLGRKKDRYLLLSAVGALIGMALTLFTDLVLVEIHPYEYSLLGPLHFYSTMLFITLPFVYGLVLMIRSGQNKPDSEVYDQILWVFVGSIFGLLIGLTTGIILPNIFNLTETSFLASLSSTVQSLFIYYAVMKHRLMAMSLEDAAHSMFSRSGDGALILNRRGRILNMNPCAQQWLALDPNQTDTLYIDEVLRPLFFPFKEEQEFSKEIDGNEHLFSVSQFKLAGNHLNHEGWIVLLKDITFRVQVEKELEEQRNLLQLVLDNVPLGIWMIQPNSRLQFANPSVLSSFGISEQGYKRRKFVDYTQVLAPDEAQQAKNSDQACFKNGFSRGQESYTLHDGRKRTFDITKRVIHDVKGEIQGLIGISIDITKRLTQQKKHLQLKEHAEQMQRLESLGRMAGGMAHDFNNLLGVVTANISILEEELEDELESKNLHNVLLRITGSTDRARDLCKQISGYSSSETPSCYPTDLSILVENLRSVLDNVQGETIPLHYELAEDLPLLELDFHQFQQVLLGLTLNAVEALGNEDGKITIRTGTRVIEKKECYRYSGAELEPRDYVYLEVWDTGKGISIEVQNKIFEPFFSTKFIGRGMGLSSILGIIKLHHGGISIHSEEGKGTQCTILLPYEERRISERLPQKNVETSNVPAQNSLSQTSSKKYVLVVDDEEDIGFAAQRILRRKGFIPLIALSGEEAITLFQKYQPNVFGVLLDVMMPGGMNGLETFKELRAMDPQIRVVFSSGYSKEKADIPDAENTSFIQKPYTMFALRKMFQEP